MSGPTDKPNPSSRVRVGIDVGGTFTHAVALEATRVELLGAVRVGTTHRAAEGVAAGIRQSLEELLRQTGVTPDQVDRVAHSTTQATNALLEGDVSPVGVLCVGEGWAGKRAAGESELGKMDLGAGRVLRVHHRYLDLPEGTLLEARARTLLAELLDDGAQALVVASAFSVDDPAIEIRLRELAEELGVPVTATHEVSGLHGLRLRTRTAALNASLIPRMLETAVRTEEAVRSLGITSPLVVMRSDGGAMDLGAMKRRPLLTMLSGPAAGLAAALMWARVSDGIFLEVGGTSTDVSCIRNGRPFFRPACIGSFRLHLETLDVRTLGVAGGSMARIREDGRVLQVGPRSAHIAGLRYACFSAPEGEASPEGAPAEPVSRQAPVAGDPADYLVLGVEAAREPQAAPGRTLTPSCAARYLAGRGGGASDPELLAEFGETPTDPSLEASFARVAGELQVDPETLARSILEVGAIPLQACVEELAEEYRLDRRRLHLVGGGGGASVWVPEVARHLGVPGEVVPRAAVVSAIGAALALLQETVERTLLDPGPEDFRSIRSQAEGRLVAAGAAPETVEVRVEVDQVRGILRAVAIGSHQLEEACEQLDEKELLDRAVPLFEGQGGELEVLGRTRSLVVVGSTWRQSRLFGLWSRTRHPWRVLDSRGRVRLGAGHGEIVSFLGRDLREQCQRAFSRLTRYGDAGGVLPPAFLLVGSRSLDLSGLPDVEGRLALVEMEEERVDPQEEVVLAVNLEGS